MRERPHDIPALVSRTSFANSNAGDASALTASIRNPSNASTRLGVPASTLESKIRRHKINKHQFRSD